MPINLKSGNKIDFWKNIWQMIIFVLILKKFEQMSKISYNIFKIQFEGKGENTTV